ncbi:amidohydrolase family protein [Streptomyces sp. S.PB5]|uniref:amidohydrolase family protein n=1 Tax=Streptomyces sp. S.PB5 TaxID=3020844 RepID=UPI0025B14D5F|nr:amidohydrolase family protein [Streptomyces sp. S.PB5]MDN3027005.1 amidohydrolase family protein [Streptomyces sp. S.PB5]
MGAAVTVDAHHHVWDLSVRDQDWIEEGSPIRRDFTVADLAAEARAAGVDRTVLVQTITVPEETPKLLSLAAGHDLIVLPHQLPVSVKAAASLPQLAFVLDHVGKPPIASGALEPWSTDIHALAAHPDTVCELSGMVTEADPAGWTVDDLRPYADVVLDAFGPDRLMFGSDWPVCTLGVSYGEVLSTAKELTRGTGAVGQADLFDGTATRVYGL